MITAGVDIGAKNIKIVLVEDGIIKARNITPAGYDLKESQEKAWAEIENDSGFKIGDLSKILATGTGRKNAINASKDLIEVAAMAKGAFTIDASVRTIISIGADHALAARIDEEGKVIDFTVNQKCAAGTGVFIEEMARILEVSLEDVGPLSLKSTHALAVNAQCVVFAETELVSMLHAKTPKPDMARAIHDAISDRIGSMVRWISLEQNVMLIGGVSRNTGIVDSLKRELECDIIVPKNTEFINAYGAALVAATEYQENKE